MSKAWKKLDLAGGGLQSANLELTRRLKRRPVAYTLWVLFPVGAHAFYLQAPGRALAYLALTALITVTYFFSGMLAAALLVGLLAFALSDLRWVEPRLVKVNKDLRMAIYLRPGAGAPRGFRGQYTDDDLQGYLSEKERERAGHGSAPLADGEPKPRPSSFAQQEALLRELAKKKRDE